MQIKFYYLHSHLFVINNFFLIILYVFLEETCETCDVTLAHL